MTERYSSLQGFKKIAVVIALLTLIQSTLAIYEFDVYRLVGFEQDGKPSGSRISSFNLVGTHFSGDLLRKLALIHFSEVNNENINNLFSKKLSGLLIILPKERLEVDEAAAWRVIEDKLVNKHTQIPVYFCHENDAILQFYEKSRASIANEKPSRHVNHDIDASMNFIVNAPEPKVSKSLAFEDFYGVLDENSPLTKISLTSSPVILVIASYDSFTFAPEAELGLNDFSSGAIALLNIAKQLSELYENNKEVSYNVVFVLTSSRTFNYEGLEVWLNRAENSRIVNKVAYAILLDSLGERDNLNLHLYNAEQGNNESLDAALKSLLQVSNSFDTPIKLIQTNTHMFNRKFPVLKISDGIPELEGSPAEWIDSLNFNLQAFKKNIALMTEFIANSVYGINQNFRIIDNTKLNEGFLTSTLSLFDRSTFPPQIVKDSVFSQELYRAFSEVVKHPSKNTYSYSNPQFYTPTKTKVRLTRINSAFFDFYLFLGNIAWLSVLYLVLSQTNKTDLPAKVVPAAKPDEAKRSKSPRTKRD